MTVAAPKKVIVRDVDGICVWGYLPAQGIVREGQVELMDLEAHVKSFALNKIKMISYVTDFNQKDDIDPERLGRTTFAGRPRGDGLWVRIGFSGGDSLDGLTAVDMPFLDALTADQGLFLAPPDPRSNAHRIFIPRAAMRSFDVLGYVTAPSRKAAARKANEAQGGLFGE